MDPAPGNTIPRSGTALRARGTERLRSFQAGGRATSRTHSRNAHCDPSPGHEFVCGLLSADSPRIRHLPETTNPRPDSWRDFKMATHPEPPPRFELKSRFLPPTAGTAALIGHAGNGQCDSSSNDESAHDSWRRGWPFYEMHTAIRSKATGLHLDFRHAHSYI